MNALIYLRVSTKEQAEKGDSAEGYSIPAQREACLKHCAEQGWSVAEGDIGAVVVHKIDRLARNIEDHVAIRAGLRKAGVQLVSVTENVEETASGKLVEGIHALMAEFCGANLATEVRKGMTQKAKQGLWPAKAPLGYVNVREQGQGAPGSARNENVIGDPRRIESRVLGGARSGHQRDGLERLTVVRQNDPEVDAVGRVLRHDLR
jgi:DNA invertase Pin-like site-specific DNA recombinase